MASKLISKDFVKAFYKIKTSSNKDIKEDYFNLEENKRFLSITKNNIKGMPETYSSQVNRIFTTEENSFIYEEICKDLVYTAVNGQNHFILGYGVKNAGKKSLLIGEYNSNSNINKRGVLYRLIEELLIKKTSNMSLYFNFLLEYNGKVLEYNKFPHLNEKDTFPNNDEVERMFENIKDFDYQNDIFKKPVFEVEEIIKPITKILESLFHLEKNDHRFYSRSNLIFNLQLFDINSNEKISNICITVLSSSSIDKLSIRENDYSLLEYSKIDKAKSLQVRYNLKFFKDRLEMISIFDKLIKLRENRETVKLEKQLTKKHTIHNNNKNNSNLTIKAIENPENKGSSSTILSEFNSNYGNNTFFNNNETNTKESKFLKHNNQIQKLNTIVETKEDKTPKSNNNFSSETNKLNINTKVLVNRNKEETKVRFNNNDQNINSYDDNIEKLINDANQFLEENPDYQISGANLNKTKRKSEHEDSKKSLSKLITSDTSRLLFVLKNNFTVKTKFILIGFLFPTTNMYEKVKDTISFIKKCYIGETKELAVLASEHNSTANLTKLDALNEEKTNAEIVNLEKLLAYKEDELFKINQKLIEHTETIKNQEKISSNLREKIIKNENIYKHKIENISKALDFEGDILKLATALDLNNEKSEEVAKAKEIRLSKGKIISLKNMIEQLTAKNENLKNELIKNFSLKVASNDVKLISKYYIKNKENIIDQERENNYEILKNKEVLRLKQENELISIKNEELIKELKKKEDLVLELTKSERFFGKFTNKFNKEEFVNNEMRKKMIQSGMKHKELTKEEEISNNKRGKLSNKKEVYKQASNDDTNNNGIIFSVLKCKECEKKETLNSNRSKYTSNLKQNNNENDNANTPRVNASSKKDINNSNIKGYIEYNDSDNSNKKPEYKIKYDQETRIQHLLLEKSALESELEFREVDIRNLNTLLKQKDNHSSDEIDKYKRELCDIYNKMLNLIESFYYYFSTKRIEVSKTNINKVNSNDVNGSNSFNSTYVSLGYVLDQKKQVEYVIEKIFQSINDCNYPKLNFLFKDEIPFVNKIAVEKKEAIDRKNGVLIKYNEKSNSVKSSNIRSSVSGFNGVTGVSNNNADSKIINNTDKSESIKNRNNIIINNDALNDSIHEDTQDIIKLASETKTFTNDFLVKQDFNDLLYIAQDLNSSIIQYKHFINSYKDKVNKDYKKEEFQEKAYVSSLFKEIEKLKSLLKQSNDKNMNLISKLEVSKRSNIENSSNCFLSNKNVDFSNVNNNTLGINRTKKLGLSNSMVNMTNNANNNANNALNKSIYNNNNSNNNFPSIVGKNKSECNNIFLSRKENLNSNLKDNKKQRVQSAIIK